MTTAGLCLCGCGQDAPLAPVTYRKRGWVKGQPVKFLPRHSAGGKGVRPAIDRFWENVDRGEADECWHWTGGRSPSGYGKFWINGRTIRANRAAHELLKGPIPTDAIVRHTCDNPPCVNPAHLILGTAADNSADKVSRGRSLKGERNPRALLTEEDVRQIRRKRNEGATLLQLATEFGVSKENVRCVISRSTWAWVS